MKSPLSLKLSVALAFLFLGIVIVIAYSAISRHFFILGMDNIMSANIERAALNYVETTSPELREQSHVFNGYAISHQWSQQPEIIQQLFEQPLSKNQLYKYADAPMFSRPDVIYFLIQLDINNERLFISQRATIANASKLIGENIKQSKQLLWVISSGVIVALTLIIWLMLRRVSQPISQLVAWTHSLNAKNLSKQPPNFSYSELNEMATLIQNSLSSAQHSLEREQHFLGFASHELRTPISVIRNNIELLDKLKQSTAIDIDPKVEQIIERINRASLTMKNLSETLLWLSRDLTEALPNTTVNLQDIITQLSEESHYLLNNKQIELSLSTQAFTIQQPEYPVRIVLGNIIRNAFQHTLQGDISIEQHDNTVTIINTDHNDVAQGQSSDLGFGLGLQLTAQLAEKLGWQYHTLANEHGYQVTITF